jgi:alkylhydroperoxidase family enzyme
MTARIEPATPPYAPEVQTVLDRLPRDWMPPFRIFTTLARDVRLFQRFIRGAPIYFDNSNISLRHREILLVRVNARCRCEYEWGLRIHYFAKQAELTEAQVRATVHGGPDDACWEPSDRLLIRLADELHDTCDVSDALWHDLRVAFGEEALIELLLLAGYYRMGAYVANSLRFPLEPKVGQPFPA